MNPKALLLIMVFCFTEAFYNIFIKRESNRNPQFKNLVETFVVFTSGIATVLLFLVSFFTGGMQLSAGWWQPIVITGILVGGVLYCETKALSLEDASLVAPISATTPASVIFASMIILGEYPSRIGWFGIYLIVAGTYFLNIQAHLDQKRAVGDSIHLRDWFMPFLRLFKSAGIRYAYACVLLATLSLNFEAMSVRKSNVAFASACIFGIGTLINLFFAKFFKGFKFNKISDFDLKNLLIVAVCIFLGVIAVNSAFRYEIVPYVGTVKRFQIPLTIILSYFILSERKAFKTRLFGGSIMTLGLILITLS